jgi:hypothetical protein
LAIAFVSESALREGTGKKRLCWANEVVVSKDKIRNNQVTFFFMIGLIGYGRGFCKNIHNNILTNLIVIIKNKNDTYPEFNNQFYFISISCISQSIRQFQVQIAGHKKNLPKR